MNSMLIICDWQGVSRVVNLFPINLREMSDFNQCKQIKNMLTQKLVTYFQFVNSNGDKHKEHHL